MAKEQEVVTGSRKRREEVIWGWCEGCQGRSRFENRWVTGHGYVMMCRECSARSKRRAKKGGYGCKRSIHPHRLRWYLMLRRCYNKRADGYGRYGGQGVGVCRRWRTSFKAFCDDIGVVPGPGMVLRRIDREGDFCPENVRWERKGARRRRRVDEYKKQGRKRGGGKRYKAFGEKKTMLEWSEDERCQHGDVQLLYARLRLDWSLERAIMKRKGA